MSAFRPAALTEREAEGFMVEQCIEIARECLAGDPMRKLPELNVQAHAMHHVYVGDPPMGTAEAVHWRSTATEALFVAAQALSTARLHLHFKRLAD